MRLGVVVSILVGGVFVSGGLVLGGLVLLVGFLVEVVDESVLGVVAGFWVDFGLLVVAEGGVTVVVGSTYEGLVTVAGI